MGQSIQEYFDYLFIKNTLKILSILSGKVKISRQTAISKYIFCHYIYEYLLLHKVTLKIFMPRLGFFRT